MTNSDNTHRPNPDRKVLLIGWDAADWKVIAPLLDEGKMPNLERLINRGVMGNLATLYPVLSPMLWTSIATGKQAWKHGIHGFSEPDPQSGGVRPISNIGRKCKAVWNILNQCGLQSNVVGWWPSHPAEPINGVMVSDLFKKPNASPDQPWPMQRGTVHPAELAEHIAKLRIHPHEIEGEQLLPFVPKAPEIDQEEDKRLVAVAKCLSECSSVHAVATATMQLEPWDFMAVYYDAIDHFSHGFMKYHPPKLEWIKEEDFELYQDVVNSAYRYHDMMLGTLMQLAGEDTTVILMSDHGFHPDHLRPRVLPNEPAGPAEEHRPYGIVVMAGPGIKKDESVFGANLLDIAPTVLTLFDLPIGRDMDGGPILGAFETPPTMQLIDSWEEIDGEDGRHPKDMQLDPVDSQEALQQLVDLGYIEKPDEDQEVAVKSTVRELKYNLARAYQGAGRVPESLEILEELWEANDKEHRFGVKIFHNCLKLNRVERARETLQKIRENKRKYAEQAVAELEELDAKWKEEEKKPEDLDEQERFKIHKLQRQAGVNPATFHYMEGLLLHAEGKHLRALEQLDKASGVQLHNRPDLHRVAGEVCLALRRWRRAEQEFRAMQEIDPINPSAHLGLAQSLLPQRKYEEALDEATASVGLLYHQPKAHFFAGLALLYQWKFEEAEKALQTAVAQNPIFPQAHRRLARLYDGPMADDAKAARHRELERQARQRLADYFSGKSLPERHDADLIPPEMATLGNLGNRDLPEGPIDDKTVVIVSGLPRSGTSMMMQMLAAGGIPVLADDHRPADESNSNGYFEYEAAKRLGSDHQWIGEAGGKAVKIVAQLLPRLPLGHSYRILFMERPLPEVVSSQKKLLQRLDKKGSDLTEDRLARMFAQQMTAVKNVLQHYAESVSVLSVNYSDALREPEKTANRVNQFLGGTLDENAMATLIDPAMRHEKADLLPDIKTGTETRPH